MKNSTEFRRIFFPYVLQEQKDGSYIALNRNYKPVGLLSEKWVDYGAYPIGFRFKGLTPEMIRQLSIQARTDGDIYLYDDNCVPTSGKRNMKAYLGKLAILMGEEVY